MAYYEIPDLGFKIPLLGLGTPLLNDQATMTSCVDAAVESGYRLFDTSASYGNEKLLGIALTQAINKYKLQRSDFFITTKLAPEDITSDPVKTLKKSLYLLNLKYLDLYMIEAPGCPKMDPNSPENGIARQRCWVGMTDAVKQGLVKHLGVSNFNVQHLHGLLTHGNSVRPVVNQVEWNPFWHPRDLLNMCRQEHILIQAYHILGGKRSAELFTCPPVVKIARELKVHPTQVLIKWAIQQGYGALPSSSDTDHIRDNIHLNFELSEEYLDILNHFKQSADHGKEFNIK